MDIDSIPNKTDERGVSSKMLDKFTRYHLVEDSPITIKTEGGADTPLGKGWLLMSKEELDARNNVMSQAELIIERYEMALERVREMGTSSGEREDDLLDESARVANEALILRYGVVNAR